MAGEDPQYSAWVKAQPCPVCQALRQPQRFPTEQHHYRRKVGMGQRDHDHDSFPLCVQHHINELHGLSGYFNGWKKARIKAWQANMAATHRLAYHAEQGEDELCRTWDEVF